MIFNSGHVLLYLETSSIASILLKVNYFRKTKLGGFIEGLTLKISLDCYTIIPGTARHLAHTSFFDYGHTSFLLY